VAEHAGSAFFIHLSTANLSVSVTCLSFLPFSALNFVLHCEKNKGFQAMLLKLLLQLSTIIKQIEA
jgi:hypothetical protein